MFEESQSRCLRLSPLLPGVMVFPASPASRHFCSKGRFLEKCGTGQDRDEKTQDSNGLENGSPYCKSWLGVESNSNEF